MGTLKNKSFSGSSNTKVVESIEKGSKLAKFNKGAVWALSFASGYLKACDTVQKIEEMFDDDRNILKESLLSSEKLKAKCGEEQKNHIKLPLIF